MILRPAMAQDLPWIRALAQRPDMRNMITDEDNAVIAGYLADPTYAVLIWRDDGPRGFAIFCDLDEPSGTVMLMRLALDRPGLGEGAAFLRALVFYGFDALKANRLWLDTFASNLRAQKAYQRAGFTLEGRLRHHGFLPATRERDDVLLYGILRSEWQVKPR